MHSRSARPLPLSQRRDLLTLTKRFLPPPKSNFLSLLSSPPSKRALVVRVRAAIFIKGKLFEALNTRLSHPLRPSPPSWLANAKIDYQPSVRVSSRSKQPSVPAPFPLRFSRALEQKWIVHDVFNARPRPTEIRRTSLRGEENALTFLTGQFFLLNRAKLSASFLVHRFKGNHPFVPRVVRVVIVSMNCPLAHWLEVRW